MTDRPADHEIEPAPRGGQAQYVSVLLPDDDDRSTMAGLNVVLRQRRLVLWVTLLVPLAVVVIGLFSARTFTSTATFYPQGKRAVSNLAGFAAQFGIPVPSAEPAQSPAFFADLVQSQDVLRRTIATTSGGTGTRDSLTPFLSEFFEIDAPTPAERLEKTVERLSKAISTSVSTKTGVVRLSVRTANAKVSRGIAVSVLAAIDDFNLRSARARAAAERSFSAERLAASRTELNAAEGALQQFLQRNRQWESSPPLRFEQQRLEREVALKQQVYSTISQSYEQARIEEARNAASITMVDTPSLPVRPDRRGLLVKALLGLIAGLFVGILAAFAREYFGEPLVQYQTVRDEFDRLRAELLRELRHPSLLIRGSARRNT